MTYQHYSTSHLSIQPRVLNIKDCPGHKIPNNAVYVGRAVPSYGLKASKWGNPYVVTKSFPREVAISEYRKYLLSEPTLINALPELKGKDLVCWCAPLPCHADVLLEMASSPPSRKD